MEKAFDVKDLEKRLLAKGLSLEEGAAKLITSEVCDWVAESALLTKSPVAAVVAIVMPEVKKAALSAEDKIDHVAGN